MPPSLGGKNARTTEQPTALQEIPEPYQRLLHAAWSLEALGHCSLPASVLLEFSCSAITSIVALFALCRPRRQHRGSKCPCYAWADSPFQTKKTSEEILGRLQHLVL